MRSLVVVVDSGVLMMLAGLGSLVGGIGGLNQRQVRVLLAYSSIGHLGWMIGAITRSVNMLYMYYVIYRVITLGIMLCMLGLSSKMTRVTRFVGLPLYFIFFLSVLFFSLAGLPPFLGFYPKWAVVQGVIGYSYFLPLFMLVIGSLLNIYYYLGIFFNVFFKSVYGVFSAEMLIYKTYMGLMFVRVVCFSCFTLGISYEFILYAMTLLYKS